MKLKFQSLDEFSLNVTLGQGGFGRALLVTSQADLAQYVIKEVNLTKLADRHSDDIEFAGKCVQLCRQEHEKALEHPNIVKVYAFFEERRNDETGVPCDFYYLVMEYCDGGDLNDQIVEAKRENKPFEEVRVLNWFRQISSALTYLHSQDILHRDIKPKNIMLTGYNDIKLGDFGTAKAEGDGIYIAIATWSYASPEMFEDIKYTNKCDVWSLGVTIYELMNWKRPFSGTDGSWGQMRNRIVNGQPDAMQHGEFYSNSLKDFVLSLMAKDPNERPDLPRIVKNSLLRNNSMLKSKRPISSPQVSDEMKLPEPLRNVSMVSIAPSLLVATPVLSGPAADAKELLDAIRNNDIATIRSIMGTERGQALARDSTIWSAHQLSQKNDTPLHTAARRNLLDVTRVLVEEFNWPLDLTSGNGNLAIHTAIGANCFEIFEYLLRRQPQHLEKRGTAGRTPLMQAACVGAYAIAESLLKRGANLEVESFNEEYRSQAIHYAASKGFLDIVRLILSKNASLVEAKDSNGNTALNRAVLQKHLNVVEYLVLKCRRCHIDSQDCHGRTALMQAILVGDGQTAEFLLQHGANAGLKDRTSNEDAAIHLASAAGLDKVVDCMLKKTPALIKLPNKNNDMALNRASTTGKASTALLLLNFSSKKKHLMEKIVNNFGHHDRTPLMQAAVGNHIDVVRILLEQGKANWQLVSQANGDTLLHPASYYGAKDVVSHVLDKVTTTLDAKDAKATFLAWINLPNKSGLTALAVAKSRNQLEIADLLIKFSSVA